MTALDSIVATLEDDLLPGLNFSLSSHRAASYVKQRSFSSFFPSGSNVYSSTTGQRVIVIRVADGGKSMLDLSSIRLAFEIKNTDGTNGLCLSGGHLSCLFQRLTHRIAGTQCEDILFYNRLCAMLNQFRSVNSQYSAHIGGVGAGASQVALSMDRLIPEPIAANGTRRVVIDLPCGLFASHYLLPIGRFPLEVTLELAAADAVAMTGPIKAGATGDGGADVNCSTTYEISNVRLLADTISLDGALSDNIDEALLQGKPLSIAYSSWSNQYFTLPGLPDTNAAWNVLINRSFSRLQSVFMNFLPTFTVPQREWTQTNTFTCWHGGADPALGQQVAPPAYNYARGQWRFQLQAGPHLWPSMPMNSFAESYYQLQKAVGQLISETGLALGPHYRSRSYHMAIDLEKSASTASSAGVTMSGLNTKASNDQIRLEWQGVTSDNTANKSYKPSAVFVLCNYACVVELRAEGVIFAD
jgi:hypothetical protein